MRLEELGQTLACAYDHVLAEGVPDHLADLLRRVKAVTSGARFAVIVEDDRDVRALAETVIEETPLDVIGCETAERALDVLIEHEGQVVLVFVDVGLPGAMDGVELAKAVAARWPHMRLVVTSGITPEQLDSMPDQAVFMAKPWRPLDVLVEAERAAAGVPPSSN